MEMNWPNTEHEETQFTAIRELMLGSSARGEWLTLAEIAALTEYGEASISAQLRHLRKPQFGGYRVEKRRRQSLLDRAVHARGARDAAPWEYSVHAPQRALEQDCFEGRKFLPSSSVVTAAAVADGAAGDSSFGTGGIALEQNAGAGVFAGEVCDR